MYAVAAERVAAVGQHDGHHAGAAQPRLEAQAAASLATHRGVDWKVSESVN